MTKPDMRNAGPAFVVETLKKRPDFLKAAKGKRQHMPGFVIQARRRQSDEIADIIRVGYTCSKKVGNAVARNKAKRRLREVARAVIPHHGQPQFDYVLIGRAEVTQKRAFHDLKEDLTLALSVLHPQ
jgi:ribonuclease P protein component